MHPAASPANSTTSRSIPPDLRRRFHLGERLIEAALLTVALSSLLLLALIFVFVGREALPVALGQVNAALVQKVLPVEEVLRLPPREIKAYLQLTDEEFQRLDTDALRELATLRVETQARIPDAFRADPDAHANTASWRYLLLPHAWTGHDQPAFVWQPVSLIRKYNLVPLIVGSLKVTALALALAAPLALAAAIYVALLAPRRWRYPLKSAIELLAGLPSVVIGFLALVLLAPVLQEPARIIADSLGWSTSRLNACVAGLALGVAVVPVVFTIAEGAIASVPRPMLDAAMALGATRWQAASQVIVPTAVPGLLAALVLGFGRAMSETMIVLMASGNAPVLSWSPFDPARTLAATIAAEMDEAVFGGHHYRMLFLIGTLLFAVTFLSNMAAGFVLRRFRARLSSPP